MSEAANDDGARLARNGAMARVRAAEAELAAAEAHLAHSVQPWRAQLRAHRTTVLLLGGFASGMALCLLPTRWWGRIGSVAGTLGAAAARSIFTPAFMGAALARRRSPPSTRAE